MQTEKLYYIDTHLTDFEASVLSCTPAKQEGWDIVLDKSAFFPEEGGQNADSGMLYAPAFPQGLPVLDVQIRDGILYHTISRPLEADTAVSGKVDWKKRFDYMQQHSGEHLISGLVNRHFGYNNVGFHLGDTEVTLDFDGVLTLEQLREIEAEANQAVALDLPVHVFFPSPEELSVLTYRSKIEIEGAVRIVEFPGYDVCACCAPHVDSTGQIGLVKVTGVMKHRGGVRVNILCGFRALADYTLKQNSVSEVSVLLSAKPEAIGDAVRRLKEENSRQHGRIIELQQQLLSFQMAAVASDQPNVFLFFEALDTPAMRSAVNTLCETHPGYCAVFAGNDLEGYQYILGSIHENCREAGVLLKEKLSARGGGSDRMIQGSVTASRAQIEALF